MTNYGCWPDTMKIEQSQIRHDSEFAKMCARVVNFTKIDCAEVGRALLIHFLATTEFFFDFF